MKNAFEQAYEELDENGELYVAECEGGISGGDMSPGVPSGPAGGITSDAALGPSGGFEKGQGCLGKGDFHVPFPIMPMLFRYGKDCCNGGGSKKKRKGKGGKTVSVKNPYAKGAKTVVAEANVFPYEGEASTEFQKVIVPHQVDQIYNDVLYYNDKYRLAWLLKKDGVLHMYKPFDTGSFWTIYATHLTQDGLVQMDYKAGKYGTEKDALDAVYKAADAHRKALEEHLTALAEGLSPKDIMNWEARGRDPRYFPRDRGHDVNVRALVAELKQKFHGQFVDIRLQNLGGTWKVEFAVEGLDKPLKGQRLVKTAVPRVDDVIRLLRIRGVETNQYDVTAVPAGKSLVENGIEYTDTGLPYLPSAKNGVLAESAAPVVSDQTIDAFTAKYYCMFADRDFQQRVDEIKNSPEYRKMADGIIKNQLARAKSVGQERIDEFVLPAAALAYPVLAPAVKIVGGIVVAWIASKLATDAVMSATKDIGTSAASTAASASVQAVADTPVAELDPVTIEATRLPSGGESRGFWKKFLGTAFGSALTAAGVFLANLFGLGAAAAETITIGLASAIACGCAALTRHMLPVMVSWFRKLRETGVIAAVEFESNGDRYRMSYSVRDGKWRMYLLGSRIFSRRANPPPQEAQQAMNTDFFRKFRERCSETLHRYLDDPVNAAVLATLALQNEKDPDMKYAKDVLSKKDEFLARFDSPTFVTEHEK